jgi:hypothetical protein
MVEMAVNYDDEQVARLRYHSNSQRLAKVPNTREAYLQENPARKEVYLFMRDQLGSAVAVRDFRVALSVLERDVALQDEFQKYMLSGFTFKHT